MIPGGELGRWDIAQTGMETFLVVQLTDEMVDVVLCIVKVKLRACPESERGSGQ